MLEQERTTVKDSFVRDCVRMVAENDQGAMAEIALVPVAPDDGNQCTHH